MMKTALLALLLSINSLSYADILGLELGASLWSTEAAGGIDLPQTGILSGSSDLDVEKSYNLNSEAQGLLYAEWNHILPWVPKLRFVYADINHIGTPKPNTGLSNDGELDLSHADLTFYYTVLDHLFINIDAGITARQYDGLLSASINNGASSITASATIDSTLALFFTRTSLIIPITGLSAHLDISGGDTSIINITGESEDISGSDISAYIKYNSPLGLGFQAGYRQFETDVESKAVAGPIELSIGLELELEGPFLSAFYSF